MQALTLLTVRTSGSANGSPAAEGFYQLPEEVTTSRSVPAAGASLVPEDDGRAGKRYGLPHLEANLVNETAGVVGSGLHRDTIVLRAGAGLS
jgi:hypothetical protein